MFESLKHKVAIEFTREGFQVHYTHWGYKKYDFGMKWSEISTVYAIQTDPVTLELWFVAFDGKEGKTNEEMDGWKMLLEKLPCELKGFDIRSVDEAVRNLNTPFLSWGKPIDSLAEQSASTLRG